MNEQLKNKKIVKQEWQNDYDSKDPEMLPDFRTAYHQVYIILISFSW